MDQKNILKKGSSSNTNMLLYAEGPWIFESWIKFLTLRCGVHLNEETGFSFLLDIGWDLVERIVAEICCWP